MSDDLRSFLPLAAVVLAIILVLWVGRRRRSGRSHPAATGSGDRAVDERRRLTAAIEKLEINLMEFARDVEGRIDTKMRTLAQLVKDADERIRRLEELVETRRNEKNEEIPPLHREVYELADSGLDKVEIAKRTSMTPGEVELILGLRRTRGQ